MYQNTLAIILNKFIEVASHKFMLSGASKCHVSLAAFFFQIYAKFMQFTMTEARVSRMTRVTRMMIMIM